MGRNPALSMPDPNPFEASKAALTSGSSRPSTNATMSCSENSVNVAPFALIMFQQCRAALREPRGESIFRNLENGRSFGVGMAAQQDELDGQTLALRQRLDSVLDAIEFKLVEKPLGDLSVIADIFIVEQRPDQPDSIGYGFASRPPTGSS